jgi:hypothetical protein
MSMHVIYSQAPTVRCSSCTSHLLANSVTTNYSITDLHHA